ncbi:MAG TPA: HD domain-containing protein [Patescibacteria group bacterium]|nr:HD domain-containing protein [Patescibacteria group bacterium]
MSKPDIHRLLDLQLFMLQFRDIERVVYMPHKTEQRENDVEHSYSLAMMAWFLAQYFPNLNKDRLIRYAMVHDLVEVHAGDTYVFAQDESISTKAERERAALEQIKKDWPDFPELTQEIETYEAKKDEESKFIYALDKIMPIMLNYLGKGHGWHKHQVTIEVLHQNKKDKVSVSPAINDYYNQLYALLRQNPGFFPSAKED